MQTLESLISFREGGTNRIFPVPFKAMYISLRYTLFEKQSRSKHIRCYLYWVNQKYSLANDSFPYKKYNQKLHAKYYDRK